MTGATVTPGLVYHHRYRITVRLRRHKGIYSAQRERRRLASCIRQRLVPYGARSVRIKQERGSANINTSGAGVP